jgi:hypothetical protein
MLTAWLVAAGLVAAGGPAWRTVAPGAEHLQIEEDGLRADLLRFDLARFRPEVVVPGPEKPLTAAALREEAGAAAAVNGGFFDPQWRSLGMRVAGGKTLIGLRPRVDWGVLLVRGQRAQIVHSREFRPDAAIETAIQVGPRLLADGQALKLKPQSARRTAVALDKDGRTLTLVVTRTATEAGRLAELLLRLGFHAALMLDGGPSSQLSAAIGELRLDLRGGYGVPDGLVIRRR